MTVPSSFTDELKDALIQIYEDHYYVNMRDLYAVITRAYEKSLFFLAEYMESEYNILQSNWDDVLLWALGTTSFGEGNTTDD